MRAISAVWSSWGPSPQLRTFMEALVTCPSCRKYSQVKTFRIHLFPQHTRLEHHHVESAVCPSEWVDEKRFWKNLKRLTFFLMHFPSKSIWSSFVASWNWFVIQRCTQTVINFSLLIFKCIETVITIIYNLSLLIDESVDVVEVSLLDGQEVCSETKLHLQG